MRTWIDGGLKEWCISRDGPYFGFEIPDMTNKFFYVWLDAPIGYLASTKKWCDGNGENVDSFWSRGSDCRLVHFIGKDIVYFHTLFWPVMLDSANLKLPSSIFVHGFLSVAGEKMSKSRGTFILARDVLDKVKHPQATEFVRFYLASKLSGSAQDVDFNPDEFVNRVNTTLSNNFGNLHHRTFVFCDRYFSSEIPGEPWDESIAATVEKEGMAIADDFERTDFKSALERIQALATLGNKYYQDSKPWELIKSDSAAAARVMVTCANLVRSLAVFLKPIVPAISKKVESQFGAELDWRDHLFSLRGKKLGPTEKLVVPLERAMLDDLLPPASPAAGAEPADGGIDISVFKSLDLRVGIVKTAEKIEKSQKLLRLTVDIGGSIRQIVAGIAQSYAPEALVGKQVVIVSNLKTARVMGVESQGMLLAALDNGSLSIVQPDRPASPGSKVS